MRFEILIIWISLKPVEKSASIIGLEKFWVPLASDGWIIPY